MTADVTDEPGGAQAIRSDNSIWTVAAGAFADWRDSNDSNGLDQLVRLLTPVLWQIVRAYGLTRHEADDVVQTTWLAVLSGAGSVNEPRAVGRWITTIARREAWRTVRSRRQDDPLELSTVDSHLSPEPDPAVEVVLTDSNRWLWSCVAQLSERCRRLLRVIAFGERSSYAKLSDEMRIPVGAIGPTRGRCLDKLGRLVAGKPSWRD